MDLVGLSKADTLGILTPSCNPGASAAILRSDESGCLTLPKITATVGDLTDLQADAVDSHLIPKLTDTYDLGSSTKLWRKGWLSELEALLFAENTIVLLGGWLWISHDAGTLAEDVDTVDTQIDFGKSMTPGDFMILRSSLQVEYMQIGTLVSGTIYNVTRNLDGSGANSWPKGSPFAVLGTTGDGRIELNAYNTPRIQLINQGAAYNAQIELIRIGDLNGNWGYAAETWGIAIGEYAASKPNILIDENGYMKFRVYDTTVMQFYNGNADITGKLRLPDTNSAITIGATPPTGSAAGTGIWIDRTGFYSMVSSAYQVKISAVDGKLYTAGGVITLGTDGITLSGGTIESHSIDWYSSTTKIGRVNAWNASAWYPAELMGLSSAGLRAGSVNGSGGTFLEVTNDSVFGTYLDGTYPFMCIAGGLTVGDLFENAGNGIIHAINGIKCDEYLQIATGAHIGSYGTVYNDDIVVDGGISLGYTLDPAAGSLYYTGTLYSRKASTN